MQSGTRAGPVPTKWDYRYGGRGGPPEYYVRPRITDYPCSLFYPLPRSFPHAHLQGSTSTSTSTIVKFPGFFILLPGPAGATLSFQPLPQLADWTNASEWCDDETKRDEVQSHWTSPALLHRLESNTRTGRSEPTSDLQTRLGSMMLLVSGHVADSCLFSTSPIERGAAVAIPSGNLSSSPQPPRRLLMAAIGAKHLFSRRVAHNGIRCSHRPASAQSRLQPPSTSGPPPGKSDACSKESVHRDEVEDASNSLFGLDKNTGKGVLCALSNHGMTDSDWTRSGIRASCHNPPRKVGASRTMLPIGFALLQRSHVH